MSFSVAALRGLGGTRKLRLMWALIAVTVALLSLAGCVDPIAPGKVSQLESEVARSYPNWTVERALTHYKQGWGGGSTTILILKWRGSEDFRIRLYFWGDDPLLQLTPDRLFGVPEEANAFISAFKARHPGDGWVVSAHTAEDLMHSDSARSVYYYKASELESDPLAHGLEEKWVRVPGRGFMYYEDVR